MKPLTKNELKGILKTIFLDIDNYDENCNDEIIFEFENVCVVIEAEIVANEVRACSS